MEDQLAVVSSYDVSRNAQRCYNNKFRSSIVTYIIIIKSLLMASHIYIIDILQLYKYFGIQLKFDTEGAV